MNSSKLLRVSGEVFFGLAAISAVCLVFNMIAIVVFRREFFMVREPLVPAGWVVLGGFVVVLLFDLAYVTWCIFRLHVGTSGINDATASGATGKDISPMLSLGVISIIMLAGAKVMADEIGRESTLGWETTGEWIILYCCLFVQLVFAALAVSDTYPGRLRGQ